MAETTAGAAGENLGAEPSPPLPPDALIIVPVRGMVLYPGVVLPVTLARPRSVLAAQRAVKEQRPIGIVMQRNATVEDPLPIDLHRMGTVANIVRYITAPDGTNHLICQGEQRFRVLDYLTGWPFFVARADRIPEPTPASDEIEARFVHLKGQAIEAIQLLPQAPNELLQTIQNIERTLADALLTSLFDPLWTKYAVQPVRDWLDRVKQHMLDNLATLYLSYDRVDDAENTAKQALMERKKLGELSEIGLSEIRLADVALVRRQYKKAEQQAQRALADMQSSPEPPITGVGTLAGLTTSGRRCRRDR